MNIQEIKNYYNSNKENLHELYESIENIIDGRICHTSIILLKIIANLVKIENYLEIGVHNGGSSSLMLTNHNIKNIYGIDLFEYVYDSNKHYNIEKYRKYQYFQRDNISIKKTMNNFKRVQDKFHFKPSIYLIQGNSYFDETENKISSILKNKIDLIHIDGDHTSDGVKNDFSRFFKFLKIGGYLVFDDYHHLDIKKFVDSLEENVIQKIGIFKSDNSEAEQFLIRRVS